MKKRILIVGSGGREHAIGWKLAKSSRVGKLYFAPGNGGTLGLGENISINVEAIKDILQFVEEKQIDLIVVGPEVPLALGIVDESVKKSLRIFGPTKAATQLESSKAWAVRFMEENKIPHPKSEIFTDVSSAFSYIEKLKGECVVKADGLAAGKGVYMCNTLSEAEKALKEIMISRVFGSAGETVVIQEKLVGREVSVMAFCDGKVAIPIIAAQDYKRIYDRDRGSNTGGMGAYAPSKIRVTVLKKMQRLLTLVVDRMAEKNMPYIGVLYGGFMIVGSEVYVLEFNCRMGDPETQVQLPLLESDLLAILEACIEGKMTPDLVKFSEQTSLSVVLASGGYPGTYKKDMPINGLHRQNGVTVFHAGTRLIDNQIHTNGGRVLNITATADSLEKAREKVYSVIGESISFEGMQYRTDIGKAASYK